MTLTPTGPSSTTPGTRRVFRTLTGLAGGLVLAGAILAPSAAHAHGIDGEAADATWFGFIGTGVEHMLLGWDHLLFIAGVLLVARNLRLAAKLISIFALGHSTTLIAATLAGWEVNAGQVDAVIASSVAFVGVVAILGRPRNFIWFGTVVAAFGLIHGLGLATRFADLGLPPGGQLGKVIAFNIGIEIGQLTAVFAMVALGLVVTGILAPSAKTRNTQGGEPAVTATHAAGATGHSGEGAGEEPEDSWAEVPRDRATVVTQLVGAGLLMTGSMTSALVAFNSFTALPEAPSAELARGSTCRISERAETLPGAGGHPEQAFFAPSQSTPINDFGHALGDGYVVVLYDDATDPGALAGLRDYIESDTGDGVLAGPLDTGGHAVKVLHQRDVMTCGSFELASIKEFSDTWLSALRGT